MRKRRVLNFPVILEPDETGGFVMICPLIPGCFSQGETVEEALANIREAIQLCLEEMAMRGEEIPDPSKVLLGNVSVVQQTPNPKIVSAR
jgi:predicted RNase H-like HicB family nuclease